MADASPSNDTRYDVVVIGSGPGGYVCAIRAAQLGLRVACVEKDPTLGGTCLNVGCIPSKAMLESSERVAMATHDMAEHGVNVGDVSFDLGVMMARKASIVDKNTGGIRMLFGKHGIAEVHGLGSIVDANTVRVTPDDGEPFELATETIVIATGSSPAPLRGVAFDGDRIGHSTHALDYPEVPKHLVVVGAGVIGLELGSVWSRLGAKVTVVEFLDRVMAGADKDVAKEMEKVLTKQGLTFLKGAAVKTAEVDGETVTVTYEDRISGESHTLEADRVLVSIGRRPHTDGLGCEDAGIELDDRGRVIIDEHFQTSLPGVFAIGDVVRGAMLAHKAEDEGIAVAEILGGHEAHLDYDAVPSIVYTHPEAAWVGKTEDELKEAGVPLAKGRFKYNVNGRAMAIGETDGFVKILAHKETDRILGAHIVGARAGDLIAELAMAIEFGASAEDVARTVHAHPTLSEIVREAALDVDRRALHK